MIKNEGFLDRKEMSTLLYTMSTLLESSISTFLPSSNLQQYRIVADIEIKPGYLDNTYKIMVVFSYKNNNYYAQHSLEPNNFISIPHDATIIDTVNWFNVRQYGFVWSETTASESPSFTVCIQRGDNLSPLRALSKVASRRILHARWYELSPNPIVGNLAF